MCQGKCPGSQSGNNKIKYQDVLTVLTNTTNDLSMPCHKQRTGAATANSTLDGDLVIVVHLINTAPIGGILIEAQSKHNGQLIQG